MEEFDGRKLRSARKEGSDLRDEDEKKKNLEELKADSRPLTKCLKKVIRVGVRHVPEGKC